MYSYFSTFIPGMGQVVESELGKLPNFRAKLILDGLINYQTFAKPEEIKKLRFLNNSFIAIKDFSGFIKIKARTFRVVVSSENELIHVPSPQLEKLEKKISRTYRLRVNRSDPDVEFWQLIRREGQTFYGIRITRHPDYKKILQKGQLRPELANLLCLISEPLASDVVLDPFAGSGAITKERKCFPAKKIISGDIKGGMDATKLKFPDNSITKIITDPPWGISVGKNLDLPRFYTRMLDEFYRVLVSNGLLIILIGRKELFEEVLNKFTGRFRQIKKYDILVSGKKAAIYKIVKI